MDSRAHSSESAARIEGIRAEAEVALVPVGTTAIAARANVTAESLMDQAETILAKAMQSGCAQANFDRNLPSLWPPLWDEGSVVQKQISGNPARHR
jgi:hypothetical protein